VTATTVDTPAAGTSPSSAGAAFSGVLTTAIGVAAAKVDDWSTRLEGVVTGGTGDASGVVDDLADDVADGGGARQQAGARGLQAGLQGKNPVWAAIKGAWSGGGTLVRAAVVAAGVSLLVLALLSPVLLLVFLLSALVIEAVSRARSTGS